MVNGVGRAGFTRFLGSEEEEGSSMQGLGSLSFGCLRRQVRPCPLCPWEESVALRVGLCVPAWDH